MDPFQAILTCYPKSYAEWKQMRKHFIRRIQPVLLRFTDSQIIQKYKELIIKLKEDPQNPHPSVAIPKLLLFSIFHILIGDYDEIKQFYPILTKHMQSTNELICRITAKTLSYLSHELIDVNSYFRKPIQYARACIQNHRLQNNGLFILKQARKRAHIETINATIKIFSELTNLALGEESITKKISIQLIHFLLKWDNFNSSMPLLTTLFNRCLQSLHSSVPLLNRIFQTHKFLFKQETIDQLFNYCIQIKDNEVLLYDICNLLIETCSKSHFNINTEQLLQILIQHKYSQLITKTIEFSPTKINIYSIVKYIETQSIKYECNQNEHCLLSIVESLIRHIPNIIIDLKRFNICDHFINCLNLRKDLISDEIIDKYLNYICSKDATLENVKHGLMLSQLYPHKSKVAYSTFFIDLLNLKNVNISRSKLFLSLVNHPTADPIFLVNISLYDPSKTIRLLAVKYLKPTIQLSYYTPIFQILYDSSYKVRRKAIRFFSQLVNYNPMLLCELDYRFTRLIDQIKFTRNLRVMSKSASLIWAICKYWKKVSEKYSNIITHICLSAFELPLIEHCTNINKEIIPNFEIPSEMNQSLTNSLTPLNNTYSDSSKKMESIDFSKLSFDATHSFVEQMKLSEFSLMDEKSSTASQPSSKLSKEILNNISTITENENFHYQKEKQEKLLQIYANTEYYKSKLIKIINKKDTDKRDCRLCKALSYLAINSEPSLTTILNAFNYLFSQRKSDKYYLSLVKSLQRLSTLTYNGLNIRLRCPSLMIPLSNILVQTHDQKLATNIIKLFGSSFDYFDTFQLRKTDENDFLFVNTTDFVFNNILTYFHTPSLPLFAAITMIIEGDPINSAKYISKIIPIFIRSIHSTVNFRKTLFKYLEIIVCHYRSEIVQMIPILVSTILKYFNLKSCVHLAVCLSYYIKGEFTPFLINLYPTVLSKLGQKDFSYFKVIVKLITFLIIYQNQSIILFLNTIEMNSYTQQFLLVLAKSLTLIAQNVDIELYQSRFVYFSYRFLYPPLLFSLCIFGNFPVSQLKRFFTIGDINNDSNNKTMTRTKSLLEYEAKITKNLHQRTKSLTQKNFGGKNGLHQYYLQEEDNDKLISDDNSLKSKKHILSYAIYQQLEQFQKQRSNDYNSDKINELTFIKIKEPHLKTHNLISKSNENQPITFFGSLTFPTEVNTGKWMQNLLYSCVKRSPNNAIHSCISILDFNYEFNHTIFPAAFISCWKNTEEKHRIHFSNIIQRILEEHQTNYPELFEIINVAARSKYPFSIDLVKIAKLSYSCQYSLFFLQQRLLECPNDIEAIKALMELYQKIGNYPSIFAHYNNFKKYVDESTLAKWNGTIGNWEEALKYYEKTNADFPTIVQCLAKLNRNNDIYSKENIFEALNDEEKDKVSDYFFVIYSFLGQTNKIEKIIQSYEGRWNPFRYLLVINFYCKEKKDMKVKELIEEAFKYLTIDRQVYISGDNSQITKNLSYAQMFVDCNDVLSNKNQDIKTYKRRIKCFHRTADLWEQIIRFKNYKTPISMNLQYYLKIISSLRKDRQFKIIKAFFEPYLSQSYEPDTLICKIKILWAQEKHSKAIELARFICNMYDGITFEQFKNIKHFPLPRNGIISYLNQKDFDNEMRKFCIEQFSYNNFTEFYQNILKENKIYQNEFLKLLIQKFPNKMYNCYLTSRKEVETDIIYGSRMHRIFADYLYRISSSLEESQESVEACKKAVEFDPNDYRNYKLWGYTNSQLYGQLRLNIKDNTDLGDLKDLFIKHLNKPKSSTPIHDPIQYVPPKISIDLIKQGQTSRIQSTNNNNNNTIKNVIKPKPISISSRNNILLNNKSKLTKSQYIYQKSQNNETENNSFKLYQQINDPNEYAIRSIESFLKVIQLRSSDSLECLCQIISLLFSFKYNKNTIDKLINDILSLPASYFKVVIPQLTSKIDHPDILIRNLVHKLIIEISKIDFQLLYFPLSLYSNIKQDSKSQIAKELMNKIIGQNKDSYEDAEIFSDGLKRSAITWFESWVYSIEACVKSQKNQSYEDPIKVYLNERFEEFYNPKCSLDELFIKMHGDSVKNIMNLYNNNSQQIWLSLKRFHQQLKEEIERLSVIILSKVSEELAMKKGFNLYAPGIEDKSYGHMYSIESMMEIMGTQQKPRIVYIRTENGQRIKYLLKGNEDLRLDERFMQFFSLINSLFLQNRQTREYQISVNRYSIISLSINVGLIQWIIGADTMHQMIIDDREYNEKPLYPEMYKVKEMMNCDFAFISNIQKIEVFDTIASEFNATELFEWMWIKSPHIQMWMKRNQRFTITTALMSMVGHIIGLGDRHPSNLMIQRETGNICHIDFGESFESTLLRSNFPEKVPFRLTRMILKNLTGNCTNGLFRYICEIVMMVLRENQSSLVSQLFIFLHEPLLNQNNSRAVKRVLSKLQGREFNKEGEDEEQLEVIDQVDRLIEIAKDPYIYVRHYPGWCPFW